MPKEVISYFFESKGYKMKHHKFTEAGREELLKCPHIIKIKGSNVEYSSSFKAYALTAVKGGILSTQVFIESGIPRWLVKGTYARNAIVRWEKQSKSKEEVKVGRPRLKPEKSLEEMTPEELRAKVKYLEAMVEFQKQLRVL